MSSAKWSNFDRGSEAYKHRNSSPLPANWRSAAHYSKGFRTPSPPVFPAKNSYSQSTRARQYTFLGLMAEASGRAKPPLTTTEFSIRRAYATDRRTTLRWVISHVRRPIPVSAAQTIYRPPQVHRTRLHCAARNSINAAQIYNPKS